MPENISVNSKIVIDGQDYIVVAKTQRPKRYGFIIEDSNSDGRLRLLIYYIQYNEWIISADTLRLEKVEDGVFFFTVFEEE